jgi:Lrp/AsnC family transcriptional regulator
MTQLDPIDRRILAQLQQDSDISLDVLGEAVGLSRNACWRRVKHLESTGVIRKRVALLDPDKLDLKLSVFIQIRTQHHDAGWLQKFARAIEATPEVTGAYRMSGDLDYLLHARVADMAEYDALYKRLTSRIELSDVSASFVMEEIKATTALPLD